MQTVCCSATSPASLSTHSSFSPPERLLFTAFLLFFMLC
eukprot:COSAG02_NODE_27598_length_606_cov_1.011834_1_plen_38_part_10